MRHSHRTLKTTPCQCPATGEKVYFTRLYLERDETRVLMEWRCSHTHGCTTVRASPLDPLHMERCPLAPSSTNGQR